MALVVDVPQSTVFADLDESLRTLFRRELGRHGFEGVEICFDAPSREWASQLSTPTVDLFLYDLRESGEHRRRNVTELRGEGGARQHRPPLVLDCTYAVTAWTREIQDEHRLLSQVLAILFAYPHLPDDVLHERLRDRVPPRPVIGRVGQGRGDGKADFWNAVGGRYKPALEYVVTLFCEAGATYERGPEVRTHVVRTRMADGPAGAVVELRSVGGRVVDADGAPVPDAWVTLPDAGRSTSTDDDGRFRLAGIAPGRHRCAARGPDGCEAEGELAVPGGGVDLVLTPRRRRSGKARG